MDNIKTLKSLWDYTEKLHKDHYSDNKLFPIYGGGESQNPKFMFVFINPTIRNVSSLPDWAGERRPFTGTKHIWRIFNKANHFDTQLLQEVENQKDWTVGFANKVYDHLKENSIYFTNIVKWTGYNADLPNAEKIKLFLPILKKEIVLVKPQNIITFGLIPFKALTNINLKLSNYYKEFLTTKKLPIYKTQIEQETFDIIPSYFPIGRGNPQRAVEILKYLHTL